MNPVRFSYLNQQFADPQPILAELARILASGDFTLGKAIAQFEERFASMALRRKSITPPPIPAGRSSFLGVLPGRLTSDGSPCSKCDQLSCGPAPLSRGAGFYYRCSAVTLRRKVVPCPKFLS